MFVDMYSELTGFIPKMPIDLSKRLVNRAWRDVRRQCLWSFRLFENRWTTPAMINAGTMTFTQGSTTVTADATAKTAINAVSNLPTAITSRQISGTIGAGIYNIWAYNSTTGVITLDQPYQGGSGAAQPYTLFQCYYAAPMLDFLMWLDVRDMNNNFTLNTKRNRSMIDQSDPQRTYYYLPGDVVYYQQDQNPNSATYQYPMFEMWGRPVSNLTYQLYGIRGGTDLVNNTDTLPPAVGEDVVMALARAYAYGWAEGNKGDMPRNQGSDFRFLIGEARAEYKNLFQQARREDRNTVNNYFYVRGLSAANLWPGYNALTGTASPGGSAWQ